MDEPTDLKIGYSELNTLGVLVINQARSQGDNMKLGSDYE